MYLYFRLLAIFVALCFITSCAYTEKITSQLIPDSEFKSLVVEGDAAMEAADWNKAIAKFEQAVQLKPKDLSVKLKQAMAYQRAGKLARAHNTYQQIVDEGSNSGVDDAKIVKIAKTNQAKFGFKDLPKGPEGEATKDDASTKALPVVAVETSPIVPMEATIVESSSTPVETSVAAKPMQETLTTTEPSKVEMKTKEPPQIIEAMAKPIESGLSPELVSSEVTSTVQAWVADWRNKELEAYIAHYVNEFKGDMKNAKAWRKDRNIKITKAKALDVKIEGLQVSVIDTDNATASFTQQYQSSNYQDTGDKTLKLKRVEGKWLITQEQFVRK